MKNNTYNNVNLLMAGAAMALSLAWSPAATAQNKLSTTLYGVANAQYEYIGATGAADPALDKPARSRVSNVSSELGVKASLPLADGMTGLAQYTTGISADNANGSTSAGMFGSAKDVFVGLRFDDIGTVKLGRMTAAARWNSGTADFSPMGAGLQDVQGMLSGASGRRSARSSTSASTTLSPSSRPASAACRGAPTSAPTKAAAPPAPPTART